jgi:hypothetical protein
MGYKQHINGNTYAHPVLDGEMPDGEKKLLDEAVTLARSKLNGAIRGLQIELQTPPDEVLKRVGGPLWLLLRRCFMIGAQGQMQQIPGLQTIDETNVQDEKKKIKKVLEQLEKLQVNLNGEIEIFDLPASEWSGNRMKYQKEALKAAEKNVVLNPDKKGHAALPTVGLMGYVRGAIPLIAGPIHICFAYLFDEAGSAWTIVHEATHKYLGTDDHAYWTGEHTGKWAALTFDKAYDNADSYARFVMEFNEVASY